MVGHSQGGMVALHIYNYFYSGFDIAVGERKIQAIGTPFYGNTGAGCLADLIKIFGFGCGANFDISIEGSTLWLAGISDASKKEVNYYTTSYSKFPYCNLLTYLSLKKKPNDGMAEGVFTKLQHAINRGNTEEQCHSPNMGKMAQTWDRNRNIEMHNKSAK